MGLLHGWGVLWGSDALGAEAATDRAYAVRHLGVVVVSLVGTAATAGLARLLLRSWGWGVLAAAVLVAVPTWNGHAMFNVEDVPVATGYTLVTLGLCLAARGAARRGEVVAGAALTRAGLVLAVGTRPGVWPGRVVRRSRSLLAAIGLLALLDRLAPRSRTALWVRSWWTFEASDAVADFLRQRPGARVLEWGSGASTLWLVACGARVTSVEHDPDRARRMGEVLPAGASLPVREPAPAGSGAVRSGKAGFEDLDFADYVGAIEAVPGELDLVVVDGRAREACLERALPRLAPGGLLALDNVERRRYRDALARPPELQVRRTRGRTPALPYPTRRALVSRPVR